MIKLNLTATTPEEKTVLEHLIPQASETLAEKINNGVYIEKDGKKLLNKKDLAGFMQYATEQAKKTIDEKKRTGAQSVCVHGDDIMNWCIHYFEEDSIEGKLYNEDGTEYTPPKPVKKAKPITTSTTPSIPYTPPAPKPKPQLNIFDMLADSAEPKNETPAAPVTVEQPVAKPEPKKGSPMYQHYLSVKEKYKDCIVFYRLGDFYEMFNDDAVTAAKELDLTLTGRDCGLDERVPMTGIPFHAADAYMAKLVAKGYKVAICERLSKEKTVERVITKNPADNRPVDVETGEILSGDIEELSVEEMRKFDGDIDEPEELMTVSKLIGDAPVEEDDDSETAINIQPDADADFDYEKERLAAKAFDVEAMIILQELFDNKITLV